MGRIVLKTNRGVTLIELLISMTILSIVSMAMMKMALLGYTTNVQNAIRDDAVNIAEMRLNVQKARSFDNITSGSEDVVNRDYRGVPITFTPTRTVTLITTESKQVSILVRWTYRGTGYEHGVTTLVRKAQL